MKIETSNNAHINMNTSFLANLPKYKIEGDNNKKAEITREDLIPKVFLKTHGTNTNNEPTIA